MNTYTVRYAHGHKWKEPDKTFWNNLKWIHWCIDCDWNHFLSCAYVSVHVLMHLCIFETPTVAWSTRKTFGKKILLISSKKFIQISSKWACSKMSVVTHMSTDIGRSRYIKTCNDVLLRTQKRSDPTVKFSVVDVVVLIVQFREQKEICKRTKVQKAG